MTADANYNDLKKQVEGWLTWLEAQYHKTFEITMPTRSATEMTTAMRSLIHILDKKQAALQQEPKYKIKDKP